MTPGAEQEGTGVNERNISENFILEGPGYKTIEHPRRSRKERQKEIQRQECAGGKTTVRGRGGIVKGGKRGLGKPAQREKNPIFSEERWLFRKGGALAPWCEIPVQT